MRAARVAGSVGALFLAATFVSGCVYAKEVTISSDPIGAAVYIDGMHRGTTPFTTVLNWGENPYDAMHVSLKLEGYEDAHLPIKFLPDYERKYFVALTRTPGAPPPGLRENFADDGYPYCANCGHKFASDARYCAECGKPR